MQNKEKVNGQLHDKKNVRKPRPTSVVRGISESCKKNHQDTNYAIIKS